MKKKRNLLFLAFLFIICLLVAISCKKRTRNKIEPTTVPEETAQANEKTDSFTLQNADELVSAMGAGWNLGNQFESVRDGIPDETCYGNPVVSKELIETVKEQGFGTIRIPISYMEKIGPAPNYKIDEDWMDRIQEVVDWCVEEELYVIINIYGDGCKSIDQAWLLCDGKDQDTIKEKYQAVWKQIATRYKDYDEHLIFESMNELSNGSFSQTNTKCYNNINTYNQIFLDTVRQTGGNNDKRWVLIAGWNAKIEYTSEEAGFVMPKDIYLSNEVPHGEKRIMISIHYDQPWKFCKQQSDQVTQWGTESTSPRKRSQDGAEGELEEDIDQLVSKFITQGYPCVIGEYGANDKSNYDSENTICRADYCQKLCRKCKKAGIVPVYWDNGYNDEYGYGLIDRTTYKVTQPEIIAAIMEVYQPDTQGDTTKITLSEQKITLQLGNEERQSSQLVATLEPEGCTDKVTWTSSDDRIATVSSNGIVTAQRRGTAVIMAETVNGYKGLCEVKVLPDANMKLRLYCLETSSWSTLGSDDIADVSVEGGTYTLTLTGNEIQLSNIGFLYIKDMAVEEGKEEKSVYKSASIKINSITFNGKKCTLLNNQCMDVIRGRNYFESYILNAWNSQKKMIDEVEVSKTGGYNFKAADYAAEHNRLEVTFTISDVEEFDKKDNKDRGMDIESNYSE